MNNIKIEVKRLIIFTLLIWTLTGVGIMSKLPSALANSDANAGMAAEIFEINCAGCHPQGGNIIRRGKTLKLKALKQYKMDSAPAIATLVENGKNNMPAYKDRLSKQQIIEVANYIIEQAEKDWK